MDFQISSFAFKYLSSPFTIAVFKWLFALFISVLVWRLIVHVYNIVANPSGIHYVNFERQPLQMTCSYNPLSFEANYTTASYSGITCVLKSHQECHVQALWGVPISALFELLHGDWQVLVNAVITRVPAEKFSSKCICANDPFQLSAGEEKTIEFKLPWHSDTAMSFQEGKHMREIYPFVVLMVLIKKSEAVPEPYVVAMANAVHVPDKNLLLYPQLIGQFIKIASGHVGQVKTVFLSSPATSEDDGDKYDLCLACYHRPVSVVFLPCRHACLCRVCFDLCERCPVCRAASLCFFELPNVHGESE